jgi:hypothetical protein
VLFPSDRRRFLEVCSSQSSATVPPGDPGGKGHAKVSD